LGYSLNKGTPDQGSSHRGKNWNKYELLFSDLQDGYDLALINLSKRHQPGYSGPLNLNEVGTGLQKLHFLILNNNRHFMTGMFAELVYQNILKRQHMSQHGSKILDYVFKKVMLRDFHDLATIPAQGLHRQQIELQQKYIYLDQQIATERPKLLLEILRRMMKQNILLSMNYFWTRLCEPTIEQPKNYHKCRPIFEVVHKFVIRDLSTAFKKIHNFRKDTFSEQAVSKFDEMMRYFISNKLSEGFGSIQSFVMHFEVLKVEEIDQTDFMKHYGDAFTKVLSERSFDIDPSQEEKPAMTSIIAASRTLNVLDLNKDKPSKLTKQRK
jgi:hypothetical protein